MRPVEWIVLVAVLRCGAMVDAGTSPCGDPAAGSCCFGNGTPGCDDLACCQIVCAVDPFCCDIEWDDICADEACGLCGGFCECFPPTCGSPEAGDCCVGHGTPYCDDLECCLAVCAIDPFCCNIAWDSQCAAAAIQLCEVCGGGPPDNDECASAAEIFQGTTPFSSLGATGEGLSPCGLIEADIWFHYTAEFTGEAKVYLCDDDNWSVVLAVYDGCDCPVAEGDLLGCNGFCQDPVAQCAAFSGDCVTLSVIEGHCYTLRVGGYQGDVGTGSMTIAAVQEARIDIAPGRCPNVFELTSDETKLLTVALLGGPGFDVEQVDPVTVTLRRDDGLGGTVFPLESAMGDVAGPPGGGPCGCPQGGVDGVPDLAVDFRSTSVGGMLQLLQDTTVDLVIRGALFDGTLFRGTQCVKVDGVVDRCHSVYDNSINAVQGSCLQTDAELGDEIVLGRAIPQAIVSELLVFMSRTSCGAAPAVNTADIQARLYANDGVNGEPGTLLWTSTVSHTFSGPNEPVYFSVPDVAVPDRLTWTVEVLGGFTSIQLADPPVVGSSEPHAWSHHGEFWNDVTFPGNVMNLRVRLTVGTIQDCNRNDISDLCDIGAGLSPDINGNGVPDECECAGDCGQPADGVVGVADVVAVVTGWGGSDPCDLNGDGGIEIADLLQLVANWGPCP